MIYIRVQERLVSMNYVYTLCSRLSERFILYVCLNAVQNICDVVNASYVSDVSLGLRSQKADLILKFISVCLCRLCCEQALPSLLLIGSKLSAEQFEKDVQPEVNSVIVQSAESA